MLIMNICPYRNDAYQSYDLQLILWGDHLKSGLDVLRLLATLNLEIFPHFRIICSIELLYLVSSLNVVDKLEKLPSKDERVYRHQLSLRSTYRDG